MFRPVVDASESRSFLEFIPPTVCLQPAAFVPGLEVAGAATAGDYAGVPVNAPLPDGDLRLAATVLLERTLLRLGRVGTVVDRRLAPGLSRLHALRLYRLLGYVRLADYLTERLGMSLRRCQAILRLERALAGFPRRARYLVSLARRLRGLPLLADAYRRGLVSWCQVRLLVRVVRPATQSHWIRHARQVTVRRLEVLIVEREVEAATAHIGASPRCRRRPSGGVGPAHMAAHFLLVSPRRRLPLGKRPPLLPCRRRTSPRGVGMLPSARPGRARHLGEPGRPARDFTSAMGLMRWSPRVPKVNPLEAR